MTRTCDCLPYTSLLKFKITHLQASPWKFQIHESGKIKPRSFSQNMQDDIPKPWIFFPPIAYSIIINSYKKNESFIITCPCCLKDNIKVKQVEWYTYVKFNHILLTCLPNNECRPSAINSPVALFFTSTIVPAYPPFRPKTFEVISNSSCNFTHYDTKIRYNIWILSYQSPNKRRKQVEAPELVKNKNTPIFKFKHHHP